MHRILHVRNVDKTFPETGIHANRDISFDIHENEIVGIIGDNGAGKSTLVTILAGELAADTGRIFLDGDQLPNGAPHPRVGLVHQHPRVLGGRPLWESLIVGLKEPRLRWFLRRRIRAELQARVEKLGIKLPLNAAGHELSIGQLHLAELAAVLLRSPRLLILDEPTAACTPEERQIILEVIRRQPGLAVVYISHRHTEIRQLCSRVFRIDKGRLSQIPAADIPDSRPQFRSQIGSLNTNLPPVCTADNLCAEHTAMGRIRNISLKVHPGEILGITGYRDHGLLLLEDVLAGLHPLQSGRRQIRGRTITSIHDARMAGMRYIPSRRFVRGLAYELPVIDSLREHILLRHPEAARWGIWIYRHLFRRTHDLLEKLQLPNLPLQPLRSFSGGMRQRVLIGRETDIHDTAMTFALVCEPTLGLDQEGCRFLWDSLRELAARGAGIILLSSSADEISPVCSRLLLLQEGMITTIQEEQYR
ncbi:MAG: ATP-binding cassette domain-containing protein [Spirochaeta sp.]